ncbi:N-acetyltransferase family protein [Thalassospira lucentensis]|uniref:GNAT family N-acetyltransferase n=1 Tax=Thalassospira lucentensis TaxID=168935 RepID=UPI003D281723|tara:strand:- start:11988 stop:12446 length:459 start_codon:yes stop_codon:yes gene_type:complete
MISIQQAEPHHRDGWERLWRQNIVNFGAPDMPDDVIDGLWQRILDPDHAMQAWLAIDGTNDGHTVVGLAHLIIHPHTFSLRNVAYLEDFWVSPDHRGGGIGGHMMTALQKQAKQNDWVRLYWLTAGDNHGAQRLYDRLTNRVDSVLYKIDTA